MTPNAGSGYGLPAVVTMGEPAGVGGEIILKAWLRRCEGLPPFVVVDDADRLARLAVSLKLDIPVERCASLEAEKLEALWRRDRLPVLQCPLARPVVPGRPDPANAAAVVQAVELAVQLVNAGAAAALVTAPVHKKVLYDGGFRFPGHTEFLAALAGGAAQPVMMLVGEGLRVVPVTIHVSLRHAIGSLRAEDIVRAACIAEAALRRDFGIASPRLAVAGLNPHAGEDGEMGREELDIIAPAVRVLKERGIAASGPVPPDTLFTPRARQGYDAAICMYHDQALIPLKALDFDGGVNVTLGLPFVRTSPDHGTALDIAGTGRASENSMMAALKLAAAIAARRAAVSGS
ncbi:MAG: 4-hydroxythreonine-4-phosphate dehydrogenase PdxA [Hyphomicrobium sp.]